MFGLDSSRQVGYVAHMRLDRKAYRFWVVKPEGESLLGRSRCRWENNITNDLKETGWESVDGNHVAQEGTNDGLLWNMVNNLQILGCCEYGE